MNAAHVLTAMQNPALSQVEGTKKNSISQLGLDEADFNTIMAGLLLSSDTEGEPSVPLLDQLLQLIEGGLEEQSEAAQGLSGGTDTEFALNEGELIPYLEQLLQLFEELQGQTETGSSMDATEGYEQMYSLFQQLPLTVPNLETTAKQEHGQDASVQKQQQNDALLPVQKWNQFLQAISKQQVEENVQSDMSIKHEMKQVAPLVASLLNKWQQDPEWLKFLKERTQIEAVSNTSSSTSLKAEGEGVPRFPTYLPTALLLQSKGQEKAQVEGMENRLTERSPTLSANKTEASMGMEQRNVTFEVKGTERTSDMKAVEQPVPAARFSHLMEDLKGIVKTHLQQLQHLNQGEGSQIRVKLYPEHLGHLDIRVMSMDGKVSAQLMASSQLAKEALEFQVGQLRTALTQQGIQVDKIEVTQQNQSQSMLQDQRGGQHLFQQRGQGQGNGQGSSSDSKSFSEEEAIAMEHEHQRDNLDISSINYVV